MSRSGRIAHHIKAWMPLAGRNSPGTDSWDQVMKVGDDYEGVKNSDAALLVFCHVTGGSEAKAQKSHGVALFLGFF